MNTLSEETPRLKSSGSAGGKNRRHTIGIKTSGKSSGEEVNSVPNYLRASTGSCHDFCKYGKHHEHVKSAIPIKFKRSVVVDKEKFAKTVVPVEKKKTTTVAKVNPSADPKFPKPAEPFEVTKKDVALPSKKTAQVMKRSLSTNGKAMRNEAAKNDVMLPSQKAQVMKRSLSTNGKATQNEPKMFQRSTSLVKPSPVTVNRDDSAGLNAGIKKKEIKTVKKAEATPKTGPAKKRIPKATLTDSRSQKASFSRAESLKATKSKSAKKVVPLKDQNRMQKSEPKQTSSDKVQTQALQGGEAESEVNIETIEFDFIDSSMELKDPLAFDSSLVQIEALDGFETEPEVKHETIEFDFILQSMELVNPLVCNESEPFTCNDIGEEESLITHTVYESSELIPDEELPEKSTITPTVIESSQSSSNEDVLEEDSSVYENSEVFPDRELLEEYAVRPTVEGTQSSSDNEDLDENPLITHTAYVSSELILDEESSIAPAAVVSLQSSSDKEDLGEDSMITHASSDKEESLVAPPVSESTQDEGEMETTAGVQDKVRRKGTEDKDDNGVKLKFRRGKVLYIQSENNDSKNGPKSVVLKHQVEQEKKYAQKLLNNIIEEIVSKLAESRKSKVKALVAAFETVIYLSKMTNSLPRNKENGGFFHY